MAALRGKTSATPGRPPRRRARPRSPKFKLTAAVVLALGCLFALAACGSGPSKHGASPTSSAPATGTGAPTRSAWLLTRQALSQLMSDPVVKAKLRRGQVYEVLRPGQQPLAGVSAADVYVFPSAAALEQAVDEDQLPAGTYGVLYDPEAWPFTPPDEQRHPVQAAARAAKVAHAHGLKLIVAPALDLTKVLDSRGSSPRWQRFLGLNLLSGMGRVADVVELQSQSLERSASVYAKFVREATAQVKAARHSTRVLAGLSSNPSGRPVSSLDLTNAASAVRSVVEGFWINIPRPGIRCPACNSPRPDIAIKVVRATS